MSSKKPVRRPSRPGRRNLRRSWTVLTASGLAAAVIGATAMASLGSVPVSVPAPAGAPATETAGPAPAIGTPFYADMGKGAVAAITVTSARFTAAHTLQLNVLWQAYMGPTVADPDYFEVLDASGKRVVAHRPAKGALPTAEADPAHPQSGLIDYTLTGPATLVVHDMSHPDPTRITIAP